MGKNKKTRWRTFSIDGSKDKDETHISDTKLNDIDTQHNSAETPHKYSQILGDHTNYISTNRNNIHNSKTRSSYNNKENYYNQRSAAKISLSKVPFGSHRTHKFPTTASATLKDNKKPEENGSSECKDVPTITTESIKFNEDEYTRITTPRQDVLFKKGYLSRMNNKTVSQPAVVSTTTDSTAPNSSITTTNSDQESSVSTLSPSTTPSMDYGQIDGMDYTAPLYYPSYYYDENGILVIPMYNGYNYYPNTSSATSPVYLMPYPYQYDPFFMAPNTEVPLTSEKTDSEDPRDDSVESVESNEKSENEGVKANSSIAEEENGARMSSEDATSNSSQREEAESDEKDAKQEQTEQNENSVNEQLSKQYLPFYPEFGYVYPTYGNGFYNGLCYYNGMPPHHRQTKLKRRKRFLSARNSHPSRSTETTTDYSDDDVGNSTTYSNRRYTPRHHNGWMYHHNNHYNYNQYHYNSKYHKMNVDKNANETTSHSNLNVNVQEFYPRDIQSKDEEKEQETPKSNNDVPAKLNNDLQNQSVPKTKGELPTKNKTSHTSKISNGRVTKKEIIEGIKSMEQQNINLVSTSKIQLNPSNNTKVDDEWNIIKNGKKIKVLKDTDNGLLNSNNSDETKIGNVFEVNTEIVQEEAKPIEVIQEKINISTKKTTQQPQISKSTPQTSNNSKAKKNAKGKKNKKKNFLMTKQQDGFEIIEPEFGNNSSENKKIVDEEEAINEIVEEDGDSATEYSVENLSDTNIECELSNVVTVNECENLNVVNELEPVKEIEEEEVILKVLNVEASQPSDNKKYKDVEDAVIDISDEEISSRTSIEIDLSIAQEIAEIEKEEEKQEDENNSNDVFDDINFFENRKNIAELERDLMENLKILDDGIDIKSPIINPLYDFPITSAVQKWLQEKQNESFETLFRIENFQKLSELYDDCENDDDESDISDSPIKSEASDSDYASDIQVKVNGSPASSNAKIDTKITSRCNNKIIVKESFCALM
ncbi:putative uncharacterized protein DDB_G0282499 isoform X2 [Chironomus tepperi]|uniref:putative uncharacterized protein DDB_G0282499 isoform X2 n=1 Tax=Chironomus tepperi TaxID=113505 RepID=UPI00391F5F3C